MRWVVGRWNRDKKEVLLQPRKIVAKKELFVDRTWSKQSIWVEKIIWRVSHQELEESNACDAESFSKNSPAKNKNPTRRKK